MNKFIIALKVFRSIIINDKYFLETAELSRLENNKTPSRTEIINYFLNAKGSYLEIGVRNPDDNFNKIIADVKYSIDPGVEFEQNPVDFKMTSDAFFEKLNKKEIDIKNKFNVIFIDGLHLAEQLERDIFNALDYISEDGFIILHDCNPPTSFHQREVFEFKNSPAKNLWNGTSWKAFYKIRHLKDLFSVCFDTDWGVAIISKKPHRGFNNIARPIDNPYFEFNKLEGNRQEYLNLQTFDKWLLNKDA